MAAVKIPHPATMPFVMGLRMGAIESCMNKMGTPAFGYDDMMDEIHDVIDRCRHDIRIFKGVNGVNHGLRQKLEVILSAAIIKFKNNDMNGLGWCVKEVRKELGYCPSPFLNIPFANKKNLFR